MSRAISSGWCFDLYLVLVVDVDIMLCFDGYRLSSISITSGVLSATGVFDVILEIALLYWSLSAVICVHLVLLLLSCLSLLSRFFMVTYF